MVFVFLFLLLLSLLLAIIELGSEVPYHVFSLEVIVVEVIELVI